MTDSFGRNINYMRLSLTDRCNLRCRYCIPAAGVESVAHSDVLRYEEMLRVCAVAVGLGIDRFKVTGGEPLVRTGCVDFIARLKALPGVQQVTLTTNGLLLEENLEALAKAGLDSVNISLDTLDDAQYAALSGCPAPAPAAVSVKDFAARLLDGCAAVGIPARINCVLLAETFGGIGEVATLAAQRPVDVRFIELMPIGMGAAMEGVPMAAALEKLRQHWPSLAPTDERWGNGPARYYAAPGLAGRIGFIDAVSHGFCGGCNRVRLTSTGWLKPCLCHEQGADLRALLRAGGDDAALAEALGNTIVQKPAAHCFAAPRCVSEHKTMNQIGG